VAGRRPVGLGEGLKNVRLQSRSNANPRITDLKAQHHGLGVGLDEADMHDNLPVGGEFDGVADKIGEDLP